MSHSRMVPIKQRAGAAAFLMIAACAAVFLSFPAQAKSEHEPLGGCVGADDEIRLDLTVSGVRSPDGEVAIVLYGGRAKDFLAKGAWVNRVRVPAMKGTVETCLLAPQPGQYAIALYHDEDANGKLNKTWVGIPDEGFGFSNDAPAPLRAPRFDEAAFTAGTGDNPLEITLRY